MKNRSADNFIVLVVSLAVMLAFSVITIYYNVYLAIIELVFVCLFTAVLLYTINKKHGNISSYLEDITFHVDNATKESLVYAPMPVIIIKNTGKILWYNGEFDKLLGDEDCFDQNIGDVIKELDVDKLFESSTLNFETKIFEKQYKIMGNTLKVLKKDTDTTLAVLYMFDIDYYYGYKVRYEEDMPVTAVLCIDNYDDVLNNTPETFRSLIIAEIENKIYTWSAFMECIIKKIERDKYMLIFEKKHLPKLIEDKFSILDMVKEIKCGNKFSATLSIGIGVKEGSYHSIDDYANSAVTLALGRGGDQVVVKSFDNVAYYGGKSREHEKTTKVKARVTTSAIKELFEHASNVMVVGHKFPDIDCIGAAIGVCALAKSSGKKANFVYDNTSQQINQILNNIKNDIDYENVAVTKQEAYNLIKPDTLVIVVDTHRPSYVDMPELVTDKHNIVLIDHHRRSADFIDNAGLVYHEPYASSTCEMIAELLQYVGDDLKLSSSEAEAIYAGMVLDTKQFSQKAGIRTFEAAAFLKRFGVDVNKVKSYFKNGFDNFVKIAQIVSSAEIYKDTIAISISPDEIITDRTIAPQAADELLNVSEIEASFVLSNIDDEISVSGRSNGNINVQVIMEKLGGGGHINNAGVQIADSTYEDVLNSLKLAIDEYLNELITE